MPFAGYSKNTFHPGVGPLGHLHVQASLQCCCPTLSDVSLLIVSQFKPICTQTETDLQCIFGLCLLLVCVCYWLVLVQGTDLLKDSHKDEREWEGEEDDECIEKPMDLPERHVGHEDLHLSEKSQWPMRAVDMWQATWQTSESCRSVGGCAGPGPCTIGAGRNRDG